MRNYIGVAAVGAKRTSARSALSDDAWLNMVLILIERLDVSWKASKDPEQRSGRSHTRFSLKVSIPNQKPDYFRFIPKGRAES